MKRKRMRIVSRMNRKIGGRTVQSAEGNKAEIDFEESKKVFDQIEVGLKTRVNDYTQVLHFNNIVSGVFGNFKNGRYDGHRAREG